MASKLERWSETPTWTERARDDASTREEALGGNLPGRSRRRRQSFTYEAFVPDLIATIEPRVSFETSGLVDDAEHAIATLNERSSALGFEAIGPLLLRSEAVASSRIEKLAVSQQNLARALFDPKAAKGTARNVAANVLAMEQAIAIADRPAALRVEDLAEIHGVLMAPDADHDHAGRIREEQNWIGGSSDSPIDAVFIPPPCELLPDLLADWSGSSNVAICRLSPKQRSPTLSSRRSIRSQMATAGSAAASSIWS